MPRSGAPRSVAFSIGYDFRMPVLRDVVPKNYLRSLSSRFPLTWNEVRCFNLPLHPDRLGPYYIELANEHMRGDLEFDGSGVLLYRGARRVHYHPVNIAQYGLQRYTDWWRQREESAREAFRAQAVWFRDNQRRHGDVEGCYPYDLDVPEYGATPGWISGMAQGEAISLLLRADEELPGRGFGEAAVRAAEPFRYELGDGGVLSRHMGDIFFIECAVFPPSYVLNGHLFALFGLCDLQRKMNQPWLDETIANAVATLRRRLDVFDAGYWSYYSPTRFANGFAPVATLGYHAFHVAQLRVAAALTHEPRFDEIAKRWEAYQRSWLCRLRVWGNSLEWFVVRMFNETWVTPLWAVSLSSQGAASMVGSEQEPSRAIEPRLRVGIIIPSKDRPKDIMRCLESVRNQPTQPDEIIVVDQTNPRYELPHHPNLVHIHETALSGLTAARNRGIAACTSDIVLFLDDDTELLTDCVAEIRKAFSTYPDTVGMQCDVARRDDGESRRLFHVAKPIFELGFFDSRPIGRRSIVRAAPAVHANGASAAAALPELRCLSGCAMAFRSSVFENDIFDEGLTGYCYGEDWEFSKRVNKYGKLRLVVGGRVMHNESPLNRYNLRRALTVRWQNFLYFYDKLGAGKSVANRLWRTWWMVGEALRWLKWGMGMPPIAWTDKRAVGNSREQKQPL